MINLYIKPIYTIAELKSCIFSVKLVQFLSNTLLFRIIESPKLEKPPKSCSPTIHLQ